MNLFFKIHNFLLFFKNNDKGLNSMRRIRLCVLIFLTVICILNPEYTQSQTGRITGCVVDSGGRPVTDLHAFLKEINRGSVTDSSGFFNLENIPVGTYTVTLNHIAFKEKFLPNIQLKTGVHVILGQIVLEERILPIEDIIVTATRTDRHITEVSSSVNIVPETLINERNARTTSEALREETGIFVQKTEHGGGSVIIRGLSSNQILILVDGIRMNNSTYRLGNHQYLTTIDHSMVRQLEVVRGPASVLYGSDALGGTVNTITRTPSLLLKKGLHLDYRVMSRYASADHEKMARGELVFQSRSFSFQTGFSYKDYDDLIRGRYSSHPEIEHSTNGLKQTPTGFSAHDFDMKFVFCPRKHHSLILAYQQSKKLNVPRYDKYENEGYTRWMYHPQNRDLIYVTYENHVQSKVLSFLKITASYHHQEEGREMQKTQQMLLEKEKDDVRTLGLSILAHSLFSNHFITYGGEAYFDDVSSERFFIDTDSGVFEKDCRGRYPDGSVYNSYGFYLQDEIRGQSHWTFVPGIRYSRFKTRFQNPVDAGSAIQLGEVKQNFHAITGSMGIIRKIGRHVFFNSTIAQAFRAPNLNDITKLGQSKGNIYEVPNFNLEPEKVLSIDLGMKVDLPRLTVSAAVYYCTIQDILASAEAVYHDSSTIQIQGVEYKVKSKQNIGNAFIRGLETSLKYMMARYVTLHADVTSTFGQNGTMNEPIGGIPPTFGRIGFRWNRENIYFDLYVRFASRQDRLSSDDRDDPRIPENGTPGWQTVNFRAGFPMWTFGKLQVAVENIFDVNYREHGSGVNGPGRNFIIGVEVNP
jgi:hemoglobin/transferrin/lactoferrin receptor protein